MPGVGIVLVLGLVGSGKTTFAKTLKTHFASSVINVNHVEFDSVLPEWSSRSSASNAQQIDLARVPWHEARRATIYQVLTSIKSAQHLISSTTLYLLDDNFYFVCMRREVWTLSRKENIPLVEVYVKVPIDVAAVRNNARVDPIPQDVFSRVAQRFEEPSFNSWEGDHLILFDNTTEPNFNYDQLFDQILSKIQEDKTRLNQWQEAQLKLQAQKSQAEHDREATISSRLHQLDIFLRRLTTQLITESRNNFPKVASYPLQLSQTRKSILEQARSRTDLSTFEELCDWAAHILKDV